MLVLKRNENQLVEIIHEETGDVLRLRVYRINGRDGRGRCDLAFDDDERKFEIRRPERKPQ